jgi:hypothetical protein
MKLLSIFLSIILLATPIIANERQIHPVVKALIQRGGKHCSKNPGDYEGVLNVYGLRQLSILNVEHFSMEDDKRWMAIGMLLASIIQVNQ